LVIFFKIVIVFFVSAFNEVFWFEIVLRFKIHCVVLLFGKFFFSVF